MKILYFDCTNGISGDMVLNALMRLADCKAQVETAMREKVFMPEKHSCADRNADDESGSKHKNHYHEPGYHAYHHAHSDDHELHTHHCAHPDDQEPQESHAHHHEHGRSYRDVVKIIENSGFSSKAKETALNIYGHIAEAEAKVHKESIETIHFHEVGRDEAIKNALGIGMALEKIVPDEIYTSPIYDGKGTVVCSHGEIPVPVPAVMALREKCSYVFKQADINMEMVTPSGLASLMGMGALPAEGTSGCRVVAFAEAKGSRQTSRPGLRVYIVDEDGIETGALDSSGNAEKNGAPDNSGDIEKTTAINSAGSSPESASKTPESDGTEAINLAPEEELH